MSPFSVTISVYKNDNPAHFEAALESIIHQTVSPNEIVLTVDGPIFEELDVLIGKYQKECFMLKVIRLPENKGQGIAHQIGVDNCSHDLIAMMDADDIAVPERFEKQLIFLQDNKDIDIVGGYIHEFIDDINNFVGSRELPCQDEEIKKYLRKRCPFNQMTVMFKKDVILRAGNYKDWYYEEDYYLWCRMFLNGCRFANLPDVLVYVRVGKDMYKRRGGWKYFKSEARLQKFMLDNRIINVFEYYTNIFIRLIVQVIVPDNIRGFVFRHFFRIRGGVKQCLK